MEVSEEGFHGALTVVTRLVVQIQARGEPVSWVAARETIFFPPDFNAAGVDLNGVTVLMVSGTKSAFQCCEWLLQSRSFGLVVLDGIGATVEEAALGRLARQAETAQTTTVFLTQKRQQDPSIGSLVSLRLSVESSLDSVELTVLRDKRSGSMRPQRNAFHGPLGLY